MYCADGHTKKIAKNTMFLYFRMLFLMGVQLYCVPVVLKNLGVESYGIYNVVGGIVTLFSFLGVSLASGSQRFIAYALGKNDDVLTKKIFDTTVTIYYGLAIMSILVLDPCCVVFMNKKMVIPAESMFAANVVLHISFASFFISLISIPYNSAIIAHEKMDIYAYVSIIEGILKLVAAMVLCFVESHILIVYAGMILGINIIVRLIYQLYCKVNFDECRKVHFSLDNDVKQQLFGYLSWNVVGAVANILRQQGINIVVNLFFGPVLNAAHAISQQMQGVLNQFINNLYLATRPQLTKKYAAGQTNEMWSLTFFSCKLVFFLLIIIAIPLLIDGAFLLKIWLNDIPAFTFPILRLLIISLLIESLVNPIIGVFQAQNKIKSYQMCSSTILLLIVPISYVFLKFDDTLPLVPYILSMGTSVFFAISILLIASKKIHLDLNFFITRVLVREIVSFFFVFAIVSYTASFFEMSLKRFFVTSSFSVTLTIFAAWFWGMEKNERKKIMNFIYKRIKHERT